MNRTEIAYLGLGSNIGNRTENIFNAVKQINHLNNTTVTAISSIYETSPMGPQDQQSFVNCCIAIKTELLPAALLEQTQLIEKNLKRIKTLHWGPRTIDIDILLYGNSQISTEELKIPHPGIYERDFVLKPLSEIKPEFFSLEKNLDQLLEQALYKTITGCIVDRNQAALKALI